MWRGGQLRQSWQIKQNHLATETLLPESVLSDKKIDVSKLKPLLFDMSSKKYWSLGGEIAQCWNIGKELKIEKT